MFERRKDVFDIRVRGAEGAIRGFWTVVVHCIPCALHGDAVPVFKGGSLCVVTGCPLLGSGTSIDVTVLMLCYWSHMQNTRPDELDCDTEDTMWKYIDWDLNTLFTTVCTRRWMQHASLGQWAVLRARSKANHWQVVSFWYLGLSKEI